jgi:hypothetical protein
MPSQFWKNATLTLETVTPSLSMTPPRITSWHLWVREPRSQYPTAMAHAGIPMGIMGQPPVIFSGESRSHSRPRSRSPRRRSYSPPPRMQHLQVAATDNGGVMATFKVPGVVNLPSDAQQHNMTIAQLDLQADFIWYTIPSQDTRTFIKVSILIARHDSASY